VAAKKGVSPKKEWRKLAGAIEAGLRRGSWVEIWEAAMEIVERKLFTAGGYKTAALFYEKHMKVDVEIAERNVRIAKYCSIDDEQTYGAAHLDAILDWIEARHGKIRGRLPVALDKLRVPVVRFGEEENVLLSETEIADIEAAILTLKK
jgi:hypothetical protein